MWLELAGAVLLWAVGTIAIAEWFALRKLSDRYSFLEDSYDLLLEDYQAVLREQHKQNES